MESITFEFCVAPGDTLDRTLGIMVRSGSTLVLARSIRPVEQCSFGQLLTWLDRIALCWATPSMAETDDLFALLDIMERSIGTPF